MSELRLNPTTGEWVIIATERRRRPHEYTRSRRCSESRPYMQGCPFCPGNERLTPPATQEFPGADAQGRWQIRVFPNKYPALGSSDASTGPPGGLPFHAVPGEGAHEVLVESPVHNQTLAMMSDREMAFIVRAYQERYRALMAHLSVRYVVVFKNYGENAGTSLEHPHSQIIATPVLPAKVQRTGEIAERHYQEKAQCLFCQIAHEEMRLVKRVVYQDSDFVVFHPFASSYPAETWIVPLEHQPSFGQEEETVLVRFAAVLGTTLRQLQVGFSDPDFNYVIHSAPKGEEDRPFRHWYLQLIPRLTKMAGFELGVGIHINTMPPEETAEIMREVTV